jgi:hypothetical protein
VPLRVQMGNSPATAKLVPGLVSTAGTIGTAALAIAGATTAIPIVGPAVAAVTLALSLLFGGGKSGALKEASTHVVDDLENNPKYGLRQNLAAYMAGPRTRASQAFALQNAESIMAYLRSTSGCGASSLEDAGRNCIADRERGGKLDWYAIWYDPIANDPNVIDNPASDAIVAAIPGLSLSDVSLIEQYWFPVVIFLLAVLL